MNHYHSQLVENAVMNANITSVPQQLFNSNGYSVQAVYTGSTINGTCELQVSGDPLNPDNIHPPVNWTVLANSSTAVTSTGVFIWNVQDPYYNYVRFVFIDASGGTGNGVLNVTVDAKDYN